MIFAFEEAIGFMCGSVVLDKDGISAAAHMATMALYLYHHGLTLNQQLSEIYQEYGYHVSCDSYFICNDPEKIKKIFERLRNYNGANTVCCDQIWKIPSEIIFFTVPARNYRREVQNLWYPRLNYRFRQQPTRPKGYFASFQKQPDDHV